MERQIDSQLREVKQKLIAMAGHVERAIETAIEALENSDRAKIPQVHEVERLINRAHIEVDEACVNILALQQPLAADLRLIVAVIKINTDLERMGDQAVNIAHNAERYIAGLPLKQLVNLPKMSAEVRTMVREALDSFVRVDQLISRRVIQRDDTVDAYKDTIFRDVLARVKADPSQIEQGLNLILISRNLERIGDHATNICEDVIYMISGKDVRHAHEPL